jgi:hypothetical protein
MPRIPFISESFIGQASFSNGAGHKKLQPACRTGKLKVLRCDYAQTRSLQSGETAASK